MLKEREVLTNIVDKLINTGAMDELVLAVLEDALETSFEELERLSAKKYLEAHHWQDYADNLQFVHSCIKVLRYFSVDYYDAEQVKANEYSLKLEEIY